MTKESFAQQIDGREYPLDLTEAEEVLAKKHGLVVVFGASDDLMEFRGAIYDEVGCNNGGTFQVDEHGPIPNWDEVDHDDEEEVAACMVRKNGGKPITALWGESDYSWQYRTAIPHATFEVVDDDQKYCRGIVFELKSLK